MRGLGNTHTREHRDARDLLPWYVNGTLAGTELEALTRHLEGCEACREELDQERRLAYALRTSEEMSFAPERAFRALRERLDREEELERSRRERAPGGPVGRLLRGFLDLAVPVRWALAAQLVIILALGAVLIRGDGTPPAEFRTLSEAPAVALGEVPRLRVVFDAAASEGEIRALLIEAGGRIVDGPSLFGVYTVEVLGQGRDGALELLRSSGLVAFAEPVSGN